MFAIGVDIVEIRRISQAVDRWGDRFLERVFTPTEISYCGPRMGSLASRWAAKEAVSKALGTGWAPQRPHAAGWIDWTEIEIVREPSGEPSVCLYGKARARAEQLGLSAWKLSMSHSNDYAVAMVLAMGVPP